MRFLCRLILQVSKVVVGLLVLGALAHADLVTPALTGPVIDEIGLMTSGDRRVLIDTLRKMNESGKAQIQVVVVETLRGEPVEAATIRLFDAWKLGSEKQDNGVLFLVARRDKQMRIEVGRGLEGAIPDVVAKRILADQVAPLFRAGRFSEGIMLGTSEILHLADQEFAESQPLADQGSSKSESLLILFVVVMLFAVLSVLRGREMGGGGFGVGDGGGGWSGGGGSSAGGGASSGW